LTDEAQVRFQPPDADWRTYVSNLAVGGNPANALNVYLFDLRDNRRLRSNERVRTVENGIVNEEPAPARLDCHYLISAWSPAAISPAIEPTLDEHGLLYQAVAVLMQRAPFNPSRVYAAGSAALNAWPAPFRNCDLPATVAPVEGFNKLAEFWSGMGQGALWKPGLQLIVTLPIALLVEIAGPMVTTRITEYRITGRPETAEVWVQIGGHVLSPPRLLAVGNSLVAAAAGTLVTVNSALPFRVGDFVTANNITRAMITQIAGNNLTLSAALAGLAPGDTLRIANLLPTQTRFRLANITGLVAGADAFLRGDDALNPGTAVSERVVIETVTGDGFVTLRGDVARGTTFNLNVAPAAAPAVQEALPNVWVELQTPAGERLQLKQTNQAGRFTFGDLHMGSFQLRAQAQDLAPVTRVVDVPSLSGEYDLEFA